jgi:predicted DsbA family dithiol-disulfide isomerase
VLVFLGLFVLSFFPGSPAGRLLSPLAIAAGLAGLGFIGIQFLILEQTCAMCLIVDVAAVLLAVASIGLPSVQTGAGSGSWQCLAWPVLAVACVTGPLLWSALHPVPAVPAQIKALWVPGQVTIVEISDFACPHCRKSHRVLHDFLQDLRQQGKAFRLVRLVAPLPYHKNAQLAARAYLCADKQGKGDQLAEMLFNTADHSASAIRKLAGAAGMDLKEYDLTFVDPNLDRQIEELTRWVKEAHPTGLPQTWIQDELLPGNLTITGLATAFERVEAAGRN